MRWDGVGWQRWRLVVVSGALLLGVYLVLLGVLWLAHTQLVVRFPSAIRGPMDLVLSFPFVAGYLTVAIAAGAWWARGLWSRAYEGDMSVAVRESPFWAQVRRVPPVLKEQSRSALRKWVERYRVPVIPVSDGEKVVGGLLVDSLWSRQGDGVVVKSSVVVQAEESVAKLLSVLAEDGGAVIVRAAGEREEYVGVVSATDAVWVWWMTGRR